MHYLLHLPFPFGHGSLTDPTRTIHNGLWAQCGWIHNKIN